MSKIDEFSAISSRMLVDGTIKNYEQTHRAKPLCSRNSIRKQWHYARLLLHVFDAASTFRMTSIVLRWPRDSNSYVNFGYNLLYKSTVK